MSPAIVGVDLAEPGADRTIVMYRGKWLEDMTKEELIQVIHELGRANEAIRDGWRKSSELHAAAAARRREFR